MATVDFEMPRSEASEALGVVCRRADGSVLIPLGRPRIGELDTTERLPASTRSLWPSNGKRIVLWVLPARMTSRTRTRSRRNFS